MKNDLSTMCYGFFSTLSNQTRLAIIEALMEEPKHVNQIVNELGQEQSMISHNLRHLVKCHFVNVRRKGKQRVYSLNHETVTPLMKVVERHHVNYCSGGADCYRNLESD